MTLTPTAPTAHATPLSIPLSTLRSAVVVRMSAIGDTLLSARTHAQLIKRGYAPVLLSHQNNSSLLECMPLLRGACLISNDETTFWLREVSSEKIRQVEKEEFARALCSGNDSKKTNLDSLEILDLQSTRRSARAIRQFEQLFGKSEIHFNTRMVAKLSVWRLLLVLWGFLAFRQSNSHAIPRWLKRKLTPVHTLQQQLVEKLPTLNHTLIYPTHLAVLRAPARIDSFQKNGHILFFVGASFRLKGWPREHFRTLLNLILANTNQRIVLCGGKDDAPIGNYLAFPANERVDNFIGQTTLAETLSLIDRATYVVTGDSFASHAADLLERPASVIFGATHPLLGFAPEGRHTSIHHKGLSCSPCSRHGQGHCRFKNLKCLTLIAPEEVFTKIVQTLADERQEPDPQ